MRICQKCAYFLLHIKGSWIVSRTIKQVTRQNKCKFLQMIELHKEIPYFMI